MQSGETHVELKALRHHGWSVSDLAREYGLSRDTVRRELASEHPRGYPERYALALARGRDAFLWRPPARGDLIRAAQQAAVGAGGSHTRRPRYAPALGPR